MTVAVKYTAFPHVRWFRRALTQNGHAVSAKGEAGTAAPEVSYYLLVDHSLREDVHSLDHRIHMSQ